MKKLLFDFFPVVLFFVAYKMHDDPQEGIIFATAVAIVASIAQVAYTWLKARKVERMHVVTMALIVVLGGLTIALNDETFIKWKPTLVNWLFGLVFLGSHFVGSKPLVKRMMDSSIELPDPIWIRVSMAWIVFFAACGALNLYVAYSFDTDTWVNFKLFGLLGLTLLFVLGQVVYMMRHVREDAPEGSEAKPENDRDG